jgi:adenylate cyclase
VRSNMLDQLDHFIYDAKLRAAMPRSMDSRIVIVDIDEKSLAETGRWPWGRNKLAQLTDELFDQQKVAAVGFDVVFAEPDDSSGLRQLQHLAQNELRDQSGFVARLSQLQSSLDYDAQFAQALNNRPVVLGYYFTSDRQGRASGQLPEPVMAASSVQGRVPRVTSWDGFGASLPLFAQAAPHAGYFNSITESDGVVRALPLIAEHKGQYYESLSLALFRLLLGNPALEPGFPKDRFFARQAQGLESLAPKGHDAGHSGRCACGDLGSVSRAWWPRRRLLPLHLGQ